MAPYFDHMHQKTPHERRQHAVRVAGVVTALVFAGWVTTLSIQATTGGANATLAGGLPAQAGDQASQTAAAGAAQNNFANQLVVATSTN